MDLLNFYGDERLDLVDLLYAVNTAPAGLLQEVTGNFLLAPGESWIVTGFRPSGSGQGPVQIGDSSVPNVAFLGQRIGSAVTQAVCTVEGPATQSLAVTNLPAATYGIFIRFNRLPGASQTRKYWSKAASSEYAQLTDTRLVATWEAVIETSAPSAEWLQIGQVVVTAAGSNSQGSTITVTDQRNLYFEGRVDQGFPLQWGSSTDRATDRNAANVGNLKTALDALKTCLVDIKGRGLATWYQGNIVGMQVGSAFNAASQPIANQIQVGDANFNINFNGGNPAIGLGPSDYFVFLRGTSVWERVNAQGVIYSLDQYGNVTHAGAGAFNQPASGRYNTLSVSSQSQYGAQAGFYSSSPGAVSTLELASSRGVNQALLITGTPGANAQCSFQTPITSNGLPNLISWLTATASGSQLSVSTTAANYSISGNTVSITGNPLVLNSRQYTPATQIWAAGVYQQGGTISQFAGPSGVSASASVGNDAGGHISILISINGTVLPSNAIINVSGLYGETGPKAGKVYQTSWIVESASTFRVACANAGQNPEDNGFSFLIIAGS